MTSEPEHSSSKAETSDTQKTGSKRGQSVLIYLMVLFAIAFLMLLLAFFMQHRSSENTISTLRESVAAMQTIETLQQQNDQLQKTVDGLQEENATLTEENAALQEELNSTKQALQAALTGPAGGEN